MKIVRALIATAATLVAATAFQLSASNASAAESPESTDCIICWGSQTK